MYVKGKELHHKRAPQEAHANRSVKPKSQFRRFLDKSLLVGASVLAFGCAGSVANTQVASLVNIPMADTKSQVTVTPDKQKIEKNDKKAEKKELEKISVKWLKDLWKKNVGKAGWKQMPGNWIGEMLYTPDGLFTRVFEGVDGSLNLHVAYTPQKAIKLQNGAVIGGFALITNKGDKVKPSFTVSVVKNGIEYPWVVHFDKLAKAYKEKAGKELKYVTVVVDHGDHEKFGEYVDFYVVPANSFKDVKEGNIKSDMPIHLITYLAKDNSLYGNSHTPEKYITVSPEEIVAKK